MVQYIGQPGELTIDQNRRWEAVDALDEAAVENYLLGNLFGASFYNGNVPDEPAFLDWLVEFCRHVPANMQVTWRHSGNNRKVGFGSYSTEPEMLLALGSSDEVVSADDIHPTPREIAIKLLDVADSCLPGRKWSTELGCAENGHTYGDHTYGDWIQVREGFRYRECRSCGAVVTEDSRDTNTLE